MRGAYDGGGNHAIQDGDDRITALEAQCETLEKCNTLLMATGGPRFGPLTLHLQTDGR